MIHRITWPVSVCVAAIVALGGCKDAGEERYRAARAKYVELVEQQRLPTDPAFEEVREKLRSIPADSDAYADAQKLLAAIDPEKTVPPRPLTSAPTGDAGDVDRMCERIVQELGRAEGEARDRWMQALGDCRARQERQRAFGQDAHDHPHP